MKSDFTQSAQRPCTLSLTRTDLMESLTDITRCFLQLFFLGVSFAVDAAQLAGGLLRYVFQEVVEGAATLKNKKNEIGNVF